MLKFTHLHPHAEDLLGFIPEFLDEQSPASAREQLHQNYIRGGGWQPFSGFTFDPKTKKIKYPGDPAYPPIAEAKLRDETIIVYPHAWVLILQKDGAYEIARID